MDAVLRDGRTARQGTLADFAGGWAILRAIRHDDGRRARFDGVARVLPDDAGLVWSEAGTLTLDGRAWEAGRRLLWRPAPEGVRVLFEDGRPFHRIRLAEEAPRDVHPCGADLYRVRYDFSRWPRWTAAWRVDGPRHAYRMVSHHSPLAAEALAAGGAMRHFLGSDKPEDGP